MSPKPCQKLDSVSAATTVYDLSDKPAATLDPEDIARVSQLLVDIDNEDDSNK